MNNHLFPPLFVSVLVYFHVCENSINSSYFEINWSSLLHLLHTMLLIKGLHHIILICFREH